MRRRGDRNRCGTCGFERRKALIDEIGSCPVAGDAINAVEHHSDNPATVARCSHGNRITGFCYISCLETVATIQGCKQVVMGTHDHLFGAGTECAFAG